MSDRRVALAIMGAAQWLGGTVTVLVATVVSMNGGALLAPLLLIASGSVGLWGAVRTWSRALHGAGVSDE